MDANELMERLESAADGPGTSGELAGRAGLSERHVRELLNGLTCAGTFAMTR